MPMLTNTELAKVQSTLQAKDSAIDRLRKAASDSQVMDIGLKIVETVGAAAVAGGVRAKFEDANGAWNIPNTSVDIEMVSGIVLIALAFFADTKQGAAFKKAKPHLLNAGVGVLAHYAGQIARNSVKGGRFTLIGAGGGLAGALSGY